MSEVMRHAGDYSKEEVLRAQHNMNVAGATEPQKRLRPNVAKHLAYFQNCVEKLGADMVRGALKSKEKYGKARITFPLSKKDKYHLLQELGLLKGATDAPE